MGCSSVEEFTNVDLLAGMCTCQRLFLLLERSLFLDSQLASFPDFGEAPVLAGT